MYELHLSIGIFGVEKQWTRNSPTSAQTLSPSTTAIETPGTWNKFNVSLTNLPNLVVKGAEASSFKTCWFAAKEKESSCRSGKNLLRSENIFDRARRIQKIRRNRMRAGTSGKIGKIKK